MGPAKLASAIGKGLFAGAAGTAAMTLSSTVEQRIRGRSGSSAPADAAGKVLGVEPASPQGEQRFTNVVHWGYGTSWGAARGMLGAAGAHGWQATVLHFAAVWGSSLVMLPVLEVAPPATQQDAKETIVDAMHHLVYATATSMVYELLDRDRE